MYSSMAGQTLGCGGLREKLALHGRADINLQKTPACSAALGHFLSHRHRRPRHVCAAISGSSAPETTLPQQQAPPIYQLEDSSLSDAGPEEPNHAPRSEDNVICTFRWPAALPGQDVSVVGKCAFKVYMSCRWCVWNTLSIHRAMLVLGFALRSPVHAGSFTDWRNPIALRRSSENNDFIRTVALQPGTYQVVLHCPTVAVARMACAVTDRRQCTLHWHGRFCSMSADWRLMLVSPAVQVSC